MHNYIQTLIHLYIRGGIDTNFSALSLEISVLRFSTLISGTILACRKENEFDLIPVKNVQSIVIISVTEKTTVRPFACPVALVHDDRPSGH